MQLVELLDEVLFVDVVEFLFGYLQFFEGRQSLVHAISLAEGVGVGLLELLHSAIRTVLSS